MCTSTLVCNALFTRVLFLVHGCKMSVLLFLSFQMTKSAPPERTPMSGRTNHAHVTRRRANYKSTRPSDIAISVEDIYQYAERERLNYSAAIRRQNLAQAQSQTQFFRQGSPISRPNTSASRHIMSNREIHTPYSTWSEPVLSRPNSIVPHPGYNLFICTDCSLVYYNKNVFNFYLMLTK